MLIDKVIGKFRKKVSLDEVLRDRLQAARSFSEVVELAGDQGFQITYEQLKNHAEIMVEQKAEMQEVHAINNIDSSDSAPNSETPNWLFWRKRSVDVWEQEMSRLVYFDPTPSHDSDARMRDKGG